jgi:hypothetical protein
MENQLFEWEEILEFGTYRNITRKSDGEHFPFARLSFENACLEYMNENGAILEQHRLVLTSELC